MGLQDWKKLEWNNTLSKDGMMWGNEKKGGMVFISKSSHKNEWRFGGTNARGFFKETIFKTRPQAMCAAKSYMRTH